MIAQREQRSQVDEEIRLQNAKQLMYGNKDVNKDFPFDVRMKDNWVVYHEALGRTEDGQIFSKRATRRYSFISPEQWDTVYMPQGKKDWFSLQGKQVTILHDPLEMARKEGREIKGYYQAKTGMSLAEKLAQAVTADEVVAQSAQDKVENSFEEIQEAIQTNTLEDAPKKGRGGNK